MPPTTEDKFVKITTFYTESPTEPELAGQVVSSDIEDHIEDDHETDHRVERNQSSPRGETSLVVNLVRY